jgi:hypothetical protein
MAPESTVLPMMMFSVGSRVASAAGGQSAARPTADAQAPRLTCLVGIATQDRVLRARFEEDIVDDVLGLTGEERPAGRIGERPAPGHEPVPTGLRYAQ